MYIVEANLKGNLLVWTLHDFTCHILFHIKGSFFHCFTVSWIRMMIWQYWFDDFNFADVLRSVYVVLELIYNGTKHTRKNRHGRLLAHPWLGRIVCLKQVIAVEPNLNFLETASAAADQSQIQLQVQQGEAWHEKSTWAMIRPSLFGRDYTIELYKDYNKRC